MNGNINVERHKLDRFLVLNLKVFEIIETCLGGSIL